MLPEEPHHWECGHSLRTRVRGPGFQDGQGAGGFACTNYGGVRRLLWALGEELLWCTEACGCAGMCVYLEYTGLCYALVGPVSGWILMMSTLDLI